MILTDEQQRAALLEKLTLLAQKKLSPEQAVLLTQFMPYFFSSVDTDEMESRDPNDLFGTLLAQWQLVYQRKAGETKLQIFNPAVEFNGWHSSHTVLILAHDDMPFLVDSLQMEINRRALRCHIIFHAGGINVKRNAADEVIDVLPAGTNESSVSPEAIIYMEIDRQNDPEVIDDLLHSCQHIIRDVELAVEDWQKMVVKTKETMVAIQQMSGSLDSKEVAETNDFLKWLLDDNFILLGYREYDIVEEKNEKTLVAKYNTGLGVLREMSRKHSRAFSSMTPEAQEIALSAHLLIIAKSNIVSTVHRAANTDIIGVKMFNERGEVIGEHRIVGLFTSVAYHSRPYNIPVLREKVREVMVKSKLSPFGHAGKALLNIIETLPRDDLFQADVAELLSLAMGILYMQERQIIRLFIRKDVYGRFLSCLVYVPKDGFNTELREKMQKVLVEALSAEDISFNTLITDSVLARIHFMVRVDPKSAVEYDIKTIEERLVAVARTWEEDLLDELLLNFGEEYLKRFSSYLKAFPAGYRENFTVETAVQDIQHLDSLADDDAIAMNLSEENGVQGKMLQFKLYRKHHPVSLSEALPMMENMGLYVLSEELFRVSLPKEHYFWISVFRLELKERSEGDTIDLIRPLFQEAFASCWHGLAENDGFNHLVLCAKLKWQEIIILRAYAKYFKQIGFTFSQSYIEETLSKHPHITKALIHLFLLRFNPDYQGAVSRETACVEVENQILLALDQVTNLDEDRILRRYLEIIKATLRTNYFQHDQRGTRKDYLSFKLNPLLISDLPLPKPLFEIWAYSPRVEGVHLRAAKVARGGIRWSDRREDFRTEVLGLMKAQKVKNAVIVPSGAKGGFVPKALPVNVSREAFLQEGVDCYQIFIKGLLDLTDNVIAGEIISPENVVTYDEPDPYLVVAADKGTATFSNYANEIATDYHFWLDDAFASGGVTGYDHKKMGITAKGAWESTKRHFREMGIDTQKEDFTVIGIGDLAGDVFGNGMLCSTHIKLIAAFNHMHIFVDPTPDAAISYTERERLFNLPRSTWEDYRVDLISQGGGIFKRSLKSIAVTPEMKAAFDITVDHIEPNELIRHILKSKVDLLWNGGIGTFVKASHEINAQVGDRTNDPIRVNGADLRSQVVVEGGNLGFTQLGRIEYALNGGRIFTDFIDNSAGVDCSDHEVNLKILLNGVVTKGEMTVLERNTLLASMTDEVGHLVLRDNYMQTQALSIATRQANKTYDLYIRFMQDMINTGKLDREIEFLPDEKQLQERKGLGQSLTAPEVAILMAYSKMQLKSDILESDIPEHGFFAERLATAFPKEISVHFKEAMLAHGLRREIIATQLSNVIINYMGLTFIHRTIEETGASVSCIIKAYSIASEVFRAEALWTAIEGLDGKVSADLQYEMILSMSRLLRRATRWFLRNHRMQLDDINELIVLYKAPVALFYETMPELLSGAGKQYFEHFYQLYLKAGIPQVLCKEIAITIAIYSALDIIAASQENAFDMTRLASIYFTLGGYLELGWLRGSIINQSSETHWDALGKAALRDDIDLQHRALATTVMVLSDISLTSEKALEAWSEDHEQLLARWQRVLLGLKSTNNASFVMYTVAIRELFELTQASRERMKSRVHLNS